MPDRLSPREMQCVQLAGLRWNDKEIAAALGISHKTVANNLHRAYAKLGVSERLLAARRMGELYPGQSIPIPPELEGRLHPLVSEDGFVAGDMDRPGGEGHPPPPAPVEWRAPPKGVEMRIWLILGSAVLCVLILTALFTVANVVNGLRG